MPCTAPVQVAQGGRQHACRADLGKLGLQFVPAISLEVQILHGIARMSTLTAPVMLTGSQPAHKAGVVTPLLAPGWQESAQPAAGGGSTAHHDAQQALHGKQLKLRWALPCSTSQCSLCKHGLRAPVLPMSQCSKQCKEHSKHIHAVQQAVQPAATGMGWHRGALQHQPP